LKGRSHFFR